MTAGARWFSLVACGLAMGWGIACGGEGEEKGGQSEAAWKVEQTPSPARAGLPKPGEAPLPPVVVSESLPSDFPVDVPNYPGAKVKTARSGGGAQGFSASLASGDDVETVTAFYADGFAGQGWATDTRRTPEGTAIFAEKDKRSASAMVRPGAGETLIDLIVVER